MHTYTKTDFDQRLLRYFVNGIVEMNAPQYNPDFKQTKNTNQHTKQSNVQSLAV